MNRTLMVVDMQNDFIDGILAVPKARSIIPNVCSLIEHGGYDRIICTWDSHDPDTYRETVEGRRIPIHCLGGTRGHELHRDLTKALSGFKGEIHMVRKGRFGINNKAIPLEEDGIIDVCGLCTDICVVSNALIMRSELPWRPMRIVTDACAGTSDEAHKAAITVMESCLIDPITTASVIDDVSKR